MELLTDFAAFLGMAQPPQPVGVRVGQPSEDSSEVLRHHTRADGVQTVPFEGRQDYPQHPTVLHYFHRAVELFGDSHCLGRRTADGYDFTTYSEVNKQVEVLATAMAQQLHLQPKSHVAIFARNEPAWVVTLLACWRQGLVVVPLYETLGPASGRFIINDANVEAVFCSATNLDKLCEDLADVKASVRHVVCFEQPTEEQRAKISGDSGVRLHHVADFLEPPTSTPVAPAQVTADDLAYIMYTSGTTGNPKGVLLTHGNVLASASSIVQIVGDVDNSDVYFSYLPLAHSFESVIVVALLMCGASIGFYSGDVKALMADVQALKPTIFAGVPRVYTRIYSAAKAQLESQHWVKRMLFDCAFAAQRAAVSQGFRLATLDYVLFSQFADKLGGRVRLMATAGAPMQPEMMDFLRVCFCCELLQGYGLTENMGAACMTPRGSTIKNQGEPLPCCEIKLVDVPDLEVYHTDQPPRGEIWIRGTNVFVGYHNQPEKTREVLDEEGWMKTGDIGRFNADGSLEIIDRKKNVFKLSQGEYVAAEELEGIFGGSKLVSQIWIYGNSFHDYLVAVVVPDPKHVTAWAKQQKLDKADDFAELAKTDAVKQALLDELKRLGKEAKLASFKIPKDIIVESEIDAEHHGFTIENDCLTPTMKLRRPKLLEKYRERIDRIYGIESGKEGKAKDKGGNNATAA